MPSSFIITKWKKREKILSKLFGFFWIVFTCTFEKWWFVIKIASGSSIVNWIGCGISVRIIKWCRVADVTIVGRLFSTLICIKWLEVSVGRVSFTYTVVVSENRLVYLQFSAKLFGHIKIVWLLCIRRLLLCTPIIVIISISGHCMCLKYLFHS